MFLTNEEPISVFFFKKKTTQNKKFCNEQKLAIFSVFLTNERPISVFLTNEGPISVFFRKKITDAESKKNGNEQKKILKFFFL